MSALAAWLIKRVGRAAAQRFDAATRDPVGTQLRKLMEIVERNKNTEYGREFGFGEVKDLATWRKNVPVITYNDIHERVKRMVKGEGNILTAEDPVMFAQTSGTTGDAKYVPVTPTCQGRDHSDQMRTWLYHAGNDHRTLWKGKVLSLVSPAIEGYTESGLPYGSTSGHIYKNLPRVIRGTYVVPYEVEDYETKYYVIMRIGVASNVSFLATANPSTIIKLCEQANVHADDLLKDLADGTLKKDLKLDDATRRIIEGRLKPLPGKARLLERAREKRGGRLLPGDYWDRLALIGCWKGGTVGAYVDRFPEWFDPDGARPVPVRDWGYLASEARGSIPLSDEGSGGVLTVSTNVYEFVSVEDLELHPDARDQWNFLGIDELEVGKEYYVFFTTTGGLYRYDINDVVEVVGSFNRTPVIVFRRKGRGMTSITGEKVSVNQVIDAFEKIGREFGITVDHFKAEADIDNARYLFKVEVKQGLEPGKREPLLRSLDTTLAGLNIEYEAKRKSMRLNPPVLHVMKPGWYDNQKKRLIAQGKRLFQAKTVLLETWKDRGAQEEDLEAVITMSDG